jgi:hypothetical protein
VARRSPLQLHPLLHARICSPGVPQVSNTDQRFAEAVRRSLDSVYDLFNVTIVVSIQPVASATRENLRPWSAVVLRVTSDVTSDVTSVLLWTSFSSARAAQCRSNESME